MSNHTSTNRAQPSPRGWGAALYAHIALVAVPLALFVALLALDQPGGGANIGAGLVGLLLLALGLPWSLPVLIDPYAFDNAPEPVWFLVTLGPAVLNVGLHAVVRWMRKRR